MVHHILGVAMRKFAEPESTAWWTMATLSQILHFAVPVFLFVSAILLTRSLVKHHPADWKSYATRRLRRTVVPFLIWTTIYVAFRIAVVTTPSDLGTVADRARSLLAPPMLAAYLLWGKAYFHLYFFAVLIQLSIALPLLIPAVRRLPQRFPTVALIAFGTQYLVFAIHGKPFALPFPAATLLWYLAPVLTGTWIGIHHREWPNLWPRMRFPAVAIAIAAFAGYLPLALRVRTGADVNNFAYQAVASLWTTSLGWVLAGTAGAMAPRVGDGFRWLGERSLGLFVVHPLALHFLSGPKVTALFQSLPGTPLWYGLAVIVVSVVVVEGIRRSPLSKLLLAS